MTELAPLGYKQLIYEVGKPIVHKHYKNVVVILTLDKFGRITISNDSHLLISVINADALRDHYTRPDGTPLGIEMEVNP